MFEILILPIGGIDSSVVEFLSLYLPEHLSLPCKTLDINVPLEGTYDVVRKQYYSTKLLERILEHRPQGSRKLLGVADVDLYIPPLSFVFGEAQYDNPAAIISTFRLRQEFYGLPEDLTLFLERCEKEAIHELGHCFGLIHCRDYRCVMYLSYSVEDIDLKTNAFCSKCYNMFRKKL